MIKLELETMLEAGFYALGINLRERLYAEDISLGADIDDQYGEMSVDESIREIDKVPVDGERIRDILSRLTRIQQRVVTGGVCKTLLITLCLAVNYETIL